MQAVFVELQQASRFFVADALLAHGEFHIFAELVEQRLDVVLNVIENFTNGVALDHCLEHHFARFVERDVDGVGVAEQIVQVAEDLLIGADQKRAENVRLAVERSAAPASSSRRAGR